jgi:hypothetical protein
MKKKLETVIDKCAECPTNSRVYTNEYRYFCTRMNPPMEITTHLFSIPEFCPLPNAEDK